MELLRYKIYSAAGTISFQKPVMVFVHGFGGGYANWVYQVRHLRKYYDLLLIELPSHGRSKVKMSELEPDFDAVTVKIMEVLEHLGVRKATFAGVSLGTLIVKHIVVTHPEIVDKYILIGPVGKFSLLLRAVLRLGILLLPVLPLNAIVSLACFVIMPYKSLAYGRRLFLASAQRVERKELVVWCKVMLSFEKTQKIYAKTVKEEPNGLYIAGELDYFFLGMLKQDRKRVKNLTIIENAGHICNIDRYEKVNDLIVAFQETGAAEKNAVAAAVC